MKSITVILIVFLLITQITGAISSNEIKHVTSVETSKELLLNIHESRNYQWPMYKHDPQHSGRSPYNTSHNLGGEIWKYFIDSSLGSTAVIDKNGTLYVAAIVKEIHAINPNGSRKWKNDLIGYEGYDPAIGPDGTIYVGTNERFHAFYPNGTIRWILDKEEHFCGFPAIGPDGLVFVGTGEGNLYTIYPNGTIRWKYTVDDSIRAPAIDREGNVYFTTYAGKNLYCLSPNGSFKWKFKALDIFYNGPVIGDDGTIFLAPATIWVQAVNPNGTEKWRTKLEHGGAIPAIAPDGTLIISGKSQYITALNPINGNILWTYRVYGDINDMTSAVIGANGTIYFAYTGYSDSVGYIGALTPDGNLKWETHLTSDIHQYDYMHVESDLSIDSNGTVYITSWFGGRDDSNYASFGYLHAIGRENPVAPDAPTIDGPTEGEIGEKYEYKFTSIHPTDEDVYYFIDWGDYHDEYSFENWIGPYPSGEEVKLNHTWRDKGSFTIKARAKGNDSLCGPWGELEVTMPKNQQATNTLLNNMLFLRFLDRHPKTFLILRQMPRLE